MVTSLVSAAYLSSLQSLHNGTPPGLILVPSLSSALITSKPKAQHAAHTPLRNSPQGLSEDVQPLVPPLSFCHSCILSGQPSKVCQTPGVQNQIPDFLP